MAALPFGVGPMELFIILIIVLILFGPKRLPQLGKSLGKTVKAIREGAEEDDDDDENGEEEAPKPKKSKKKDEDEEDEE
jgi:sec-independent protein translocase protein TatA